MFAGKIVIITGAGAGIGRALASQLLEQKAVVWAWDRDPEALETLAAEHRKFGHEIFTAALDVTDREAMSEAAVRVLKRHHRIHVWVNNAGISGIGDFTKTSPEMFERVLDVNLRAVVHGTRLALAHMDETGGGTIVNLGSIAGFVPSPYLAAYCASKHAVVGFTRALREEMRMKDSAVKLMLVSPGFVDTRMIERDSVVGFPDWLSWTLSKPEQVAAEIVSGLKRGREEITPTWNGRLMQEMHKWLPRTTRKSAKVLLTKSFKDLVFRRYTIG